MNKPSGTDVMQCALSKLGGSPHEPSASGHIWLLSTHALVLDTALTSSLTIYTTWRQLWPACSRGILNPMAFNQCMPLRATCVLNSHLSKCDLCLALQLQAFLFGFTETCVYFDLSWLKVTVESQNAVNSRVLVGNIFPSLS